MGEDAIDKSGYNEASYKMLRLHESQRRISFVNQDLAAFYPELNGYGYIVKKTELENLMQEVWGKLDDASKKKVNGMRNLMDDYLDFFPVQKTVKVNGIDGEKKKKDFNKENFKALKTIMIEVHSYVNELLEAAGYSTFTIDADDGDPYN